jgi:hypothetical protein
MNQLIITSAAVASMAVALGCGGSYPTPTQPMADAESASRSARELGADSKPAAQLHLKLASDQIALAKTAVQDGDNKRAGFLLLRARADAELAIALSREQDANLEQQKAIDKSTAAAAATANGVK